jgi:hypothetical protein
MSPNDFTLQNMPNLEQLWAQAVADVIEDIEARGAQAKRKVTVSVTFEVFADGVVVVTPDVKPSMSSGVKQTGVPVKCKINGGEIRIVDAQPRLDLDA